MQTIPRSPSLISTLICVLSLVLGYYIPRYIMSSQPKLFQPIKVGNVTLQQRVALAPLTRVKADEEHVPSLPLVQEYYKQRSSSPGTLLITEATFIAPQAGGYTNVPGIWSDKQIEHWKQITDSVHAQGSFIYLQLWALGRAAEKSNLDPEGLPYISASDIPLTYKKDAPRALTKEEIAEYVQLYSQAASNAVNRAGFDGVEIHGANGYLVDQFLQDVSNNRTDEYGGSIENRARFGLEVIEGVVKAVGAERTAIRLSPWNNFQEMRMEDPKPTFAYFVSQIRDLFPNLAYLHVVEARVLGADTREEHTIPAGENNDFIREIWSPRPLVSAGGYDRSLALSVAEQKGDIIAFGRQYISNPDLPLRLQKNLPLSPYDRATFYLAGNFSPLGYTDYPFATVETRL
ncbi:hypothetical protein HGRIS_007191 [Hohenbuehelia grisea]|uniref:NADH:flavin oxidoreductase/NADH oxidase N-terminal domain-containing protein n=1 Tax=Hohenbuehelia grisea TaxID=104357 RepID=A0ABR3JBF9_9AGAR